MDDVVVHLPISRSRWCTLSVSVLGHTYSLMTTFVPSIQRGSGSRGSPEIQQHNDVMRWRIPRSGLRQAEDHGMEQRVERKGGEASPWEGKPSPSFYRGGVGSPRGGVRPTHGAPTSSPLDVSGSHTHTHSCSLNCPLGKSKGFL